MLRLKFRPLVTLLFFLLAPSLGAQDFQDEIQVYTNDIQKPGRWDWRCT